jgi:4-amino-4-deoxy-L-arabinose transferase-like glycosyltransferase
MDATLTSSLRYWLAPVLIGIASLLIYSINLEKPPHHDELYHMLAAKGLLATGEPAIGEDGRYWRGYPWTWLVARSFELFGESLSAGRLPSVVLMAALVVLLFEFLRREAGGTAAWLRFGDAAVPQDRPARCSRHLGPRGPWPRLGQRPARLVIIGAQLFR